MNVHQVDVAPGATIRANKRWKNVGGDGTRDIYVFYGRGETQETFIMEFGAAAVEQYCAAGDEVTTPVDCEVPLDATPGLKNALVAVGGYVYPTLVYDDYEIVANAINVTGAPPPQGVALNAGWNNVTYMGPSQAIESAVAKIMPFLIVIGVYRNGMNYYYYDPTDPGSTLDYLYYGEAVWVNVTQACFWSW